VTNLDISGAAENILSDVKELKYFIPQMGKYKIMDNIVKQCKIMYNRLPEVVHQYKPRGD
jgi:hypothetical protein